jgi:hypothetical protein
MTFTFQGGVESQFKMTKVQGDQAPPKRKKMLRKYENSFTKTIAEQPMSSQTPLEFATGLNRKFESLI